MRRFRLIFVLFAIFSVALPAWAASNAVTAPHLTVQLVSREAGVAAPGSTDAGLYFKLEPGWHVYWKNAGDSGEPPRIDWTLPKGLTVDAMQFPAPKRLALGPLMDYGYENEALFPIRLAADASLKPGTALHLAAKVSWLVCNNVCLPGKANLALDLPVVASTPTEDGASAALFNRLKSTLPQPLPASAKVVFQPTADGFRLAVETGQRETEAAFFPEEQSVLDNPAPQKLISTAKGFLLDLKKDADLTANPAQLRGVLELSGGRNYEISALPGTIAAPVAAPSFAFGGFARVVALAFLGGLLLNLMPCVFPVLFLKGLALVQSGSEERRRLRAHGLFYTAGILVSFWALVAALVALRSAGATLGWGFQFQSPVFLALMAGLLFFLALSLAGQFEIGLTLTSAGGSLAAKQGYVGSFFTGVLAVIVATPCTAPFMGAAVGYALAQPVAIAFAVFTALALGLAAPYVALTLQPAWTRLLPKPGAWMEILKQAVAVPLFATVIWLAWVLAQAYGAGLLAALLASFLLLAVAGWFLGRWPARRWATIIAALVLLSVVALDALAPRKISIAPQNAPEGTAARGTWQPWSAEAVQRAHAAGQPVFVDFTANWCLICQTNERVALDRPEVMDAFAAHHVLLLKADWTRQDSAITEALAALGRSGVPVYALYAPGESQPQLLPQTLTPGIVVEALGKLPKRIR
jgi:thiol:disulfide interchange protein DsbD